MRQWGAAQPVKHRAAGVTGVLCNGACMAGHSVVLETVFLSGSGGPETEAVAAATETTEGPRALS